MAFGRWKSDSSSSMRPASIFDRSRMSLMRERRCRPDSNARAAVGRIAEARALSGFSSDEFF
jgi:hypothetical protein